MLCRWSCGVCVCFFSVQLSSLYVICRFTAFTSTNDHYLWDMEWWYEGKKWKWKRNQSYVSIGQSLQNHKLRHSSDICLDFWMNRQFRALHTTFAFKMWWFYQKYICRMCVCVFCSFIHQNIRESKINSRAKQRFDERISRDVVLTIRYD